MNGFGFIRLMLNPCIRLGHDLDTPLAKAEEDRECWEPQELSRVVPLLSDAVITEVEAFMNDQFARQYAVRKPDGTLVVSPYTGKTLLWDTRETAEHVMLHFREHAAEIGITEWLGEIVHCYISPFISDRDDGQQLITELQAWMRRQGGAK